MESKLEGLSASTHDYFKRIWISVIQDKLDSLEGESKMLGRLMLEHPEYHHLWTKPYSRAQMDVERLVAQGEASPHLHLAIETNVLKQIEEKKPPEVRKAFNALRAASIEKRKARHVLGRVLAGVVWEISHADAEKLGYNSLYINRLKEISRNPLAVVKEQVQQLRQVI